jgi:hypothetical protein
MKEALKKIKTDNVLESNGVSIEIWRYFGGIAVMWLTKLFNSIFSQIRYLMSGKEVY